ncbi:hypothetical protein CC86DRAFT_391802 [Ophiobolus disseminans]|uniref:TNT domain-containing protein n=1 Tax=Ophiobolus disseminans TaxID=1469910 RepID=A0A6A7AAK2_9PLEO|nr:hypothetical protein CC86DRAFT_391802 [Ophiobolus disseminans]
MFMVALQIIFALLAVEHTHAAPLDKGDPLNRIEDTTTDYAMEYNYTLPKGYKLDADLTDTHRCRPSFCAGTIDSNHSFYVCGDPRLGPVVLSSCLPMTPHYSFNRFGGLCPGEFLATWTNYATPGPVGNFRYPYSDGFANNTAGEPIRKYMTLKPGVQLDRFGGIGMFVAPARSPYEQRSIPPESLNWAHEDPLQAPYNYHVYEVQQPLGVISGPVAPWFGQPWLGMQFMLVRSTQELMDLGMLKRVVDEEKCKVTPEDS